MKLSDMDDTIQIGELSRGGVDSSVAGGDDGVEMTPFGAGANIGRELPEDKEREISGQERVKTTEEV